MIYKLFNYVIYWRLFELVNMASKVLLCLYGCLLYLKFYP